MAARRGIDQCDGERIAGPFGVNAGAWGTWDEFETMVTLDIAPGPITLVATDGNGCTPGDPECGEPNPATAAVTKDATAQVGFEIACEALPIGSLEVTTTVTNNFDPDGFQVHVAGANQGSVDVNGSVTFDGLTSGVQQVELTGIAPNCEVDGDNPATVTIPTGGSATTDFSIICTDPPDGRIAIIAPGVHPDYRGE